MDPHQNTGSPLPINRIKPSLMTYLSKTGEAEEEGPTSRGEQEAQASPSQQMWDPERWNKWGWYHSTLELPGRAGCGEE